MPKPGFTGEYIINRYKSPFLTVTISNCFSGFGQDPVVVMHLLSQALAHQLVASDGRGGL